MGTLFGFEETKGNLSRLNRVPPILRPVLPFLIMMVAVAVCLTSTAAFLSWRCSTDIEKWLPIYPRAELMNEWHNFQERSMGITTMTLLSTDEPDVVRRWYYQQREAASNQDTNRGIATTKFEIHDNPDGAGSMIYLYSQCVQ